MHSGQTDIVMMVSKHQPRTTGATTAANKYKDFRVLARCLHESGWLGRRRHHFGSWRAGRAELTDAVGAGTAVSAHCWASSVLLLVVGAFVCERDSKLSQEFKIIIN